MDNNASLFDRMGGQGAVFQLANRFYDVMQRDDVARDVLDMHPDDLTRSRKRLAHYLCEWFGGPKLFGEPYVNPTWLKQRHIHLDIGIEARDQWMHCMLTAMNELNYEEQLSQELAKKFYELAGYLRTKV